MNTHALMLAGARLTLLPSGVLWWEEVRLMAAGDLHLGRSGRMARLGGGLLPPYDTLDTLDRLGAEAARLRPRTLVLLGDSFDDMTAAGELDGGGVGGAGEGGAGKGAADRLVALAAGRRLVWIAGNHDPAPAALPGTHRDEWHEGPLVFRHIARPDAAPGEVSGHYHPKARLSLRGQPIARSCFLSDGARLILPAFGTYTGGLDIRDAAFDALMGPGATAYLTGRSVTALPRRALLRARAGA